MPGFVEPDSVTTVTAAGTTLPPGIYTRLVWTLGALDADEVVALPYAAGIPLRANALFPVGTAPTPGSGEQGSNLDNNTGASTREGASEQSATNLASVTGDYQGPVAPGAGTAVSDSATATVSIEDLRMRKSVSPSRFQAGGIADTTSSSTRASTRRARTSSSPTSCPPASARSVAPARTTCRGARHLRRRGGHDTVVALRLGDQQPRRHVHRRVRARWRCRPTAR